MPSLRRLAADQLGALLAAAASRTAGTAAGEEWQQQTDACLQLVRLLQDPDAGVASAAAAALRAFGTRRGGHGAEHAVLQVLLGPGSPVAAALAEAAQRDGSGTIRLRVVALALALAAAAPGDAPSGWGRAAPPGATRASQPSAGRGSTQRCRGWGDESRAKHRRASPRLPKLHARAPLRRPLPNGHAETGAAEPPSASPSASHADDDPAVRLELLRGSGLLAPLLQQVGRVGGRWMLALCREGSSAVLIPAAARRARSDPPLPPSRDVPRSWPTPPTRWPAWRRCSCCRSCLRGRRRRGEQVAGAAGRGA